MTTFHFEVTYTSEGSSEKIKITTSAEANTTEEAQEIIKEKFRRRFKADEFFSFNKVDLDKPKK